MSQSKLKFIRSLSQQKYRKAYNSYLVEGSKNAKEWLSASMKINFIVALSEWLMENKALIKLHPEAEVLEVKESDLQKATSLKTAQSVILVVEKEKENPLPEFFEGWSLLLEDIKDPGNMGTILRIADWFGIENIFYTPQCVEMYNPKVVQASMGSLLRVNLYEQNVEELIEFFKRKEYPVYATVLDGIDILKDKNKKWKPGIIAMGNESLGLSNTLIDAAAYKIKIGGKGSAESLNVGIATGIFCSILS